MYFIHGPPVFSILAQRVPRAGPHLARVECGCTEAAIVLVAPAHKIASVRVRHAIGIVERSSKVASVHAKGDEARTTVGRIDVVCPSAIARYQQPHIEDSVTSAQGHAVNVSME